MMTISMVTIGDQGDGPGYGQQCSHHPHTPLAAQWRVSPLCWRARPRFNYYLQLSRVSECRDINISSISHSPKLQPLLRISSHPPTAKQTGKADTEIKIILQTGISWLRGIVSPLDVTHVTSVARILNITSHLLTLRPGFNIKLDSVKHGSLSGRRQWGQH